MEESEVTVSERSEGHVVNDTILIRGKQIPVVNEYIEQVKLKFFPDNPRVYSLVRGNTDVPSQEEIERQLLEMEHVRQLIQDIRVNEGLIEPLIVKDGTFEVLEGNSRVAAYRYLARSNPIKWGLVKCTVLPKDIDESLVFALLGQYHIKGKKDWAPYEQAGFLYRRFKRHNVDLPTLAREIGLSQRRAKHFIETYQFMIDNNEVDVNRWSYYDEYLKSSKIRKVKECCPELDSLIVQKVKSGEIGRAVDIRDHLPVICTASKKVFMKFVNGALPFADAYDLALDAGGDNTCLKRLSKFRKWLISQEVEESLRRSKGQTRGKLQYELEKLNTRIKALRSKLKGGHHG